MDKFHNVKNVNVDRIKEFAKSKGITMKFLCDCLGKRRTFLTDVRRGVDHIDENELSIIADKLNTTVEYLTGQTDDPTRPEEKKEPGAITDAEQSELEAMFLQLSPERQDWVLRLMSMAIAEQEKEEREKKEGLRKPPKQPE